MVDCCDRRNGDGSIWMISLVLQDQLVLENGGGESLGGLMEQSLGRKDNGPRPSGKTS